MKKPLKATLASASRVALRGLAFLVPAAIGVGLFLYMTRTEREAPRSQKREVVRQMRVIDVTSMKLVPRAEGYGIAEADRTWRAVARVGGRVVEVHPDLRSGARLPSDSLLVKIETMDFEITIASARAEIARLQAELQMLDIEESNNKRSLDIEKSILSVVTAELERIEQLVKKDASSTADYEEKQRAQLAQEQTVLGIEGSLALLPASRASLNAQLDGAQASLARAERDLEFCEIRAPFSGSVGSVAIEVGQYVAAQEELFEVYFDDSLRVDALIQEDQLLRLHDDAARKAIMEMLADTTRSARFVEGLFQARVAANIGSIERAWPARVVGVRESLDTETRALRLTVLVDQGSEELLRAQGPPLSRGSFCKVEIRSRTRDAVVIPRSAVRDGDVFWLDAENRLRRSSVDVEFYQGEIAVVRDGIKPGVKLVVSDPTPATEGVLVEAVFDEELAAALEYEASAGAMR